MSTRTTEFAAQITGDANGAVAALEKVKVRVQDTAKAAESANVKVAGSTDVLIKQSEKAAKGVAAITQALYAMEAEGSSRVLAIGGAIGNFADLLGPGGKVVSGIAIVTASIAALFLQAKEKSAEARKALEADIAGLIDAADIDGIKQRAQRLSEGTASKGFSDGVAARRERIAQLEQEALLAGKSNRFYQDRLRLIAQEKRELKEIQDQLTRLMQAAQQLPEARAPRGLEGQAVVVTAESSERAVANAKAAAEAWKKLEKAAADTEEKMAKAAASAITQATQALEGINDQNAIRLRLTLEQVTAENNLREERELSLSAAANELKAALQGEEAFRRFREERERNAFIEAELAKAREAAIARGTTLTSAQVLEIRAQAALTFEFRDGAADVADEFGRANDQIGNLYEGLALSLSAASGVAAAFGEAGQNAGILLNQTAQLLTNLGRARKIGIFTDSAGKTQNVGFTGALTGKAGVAGVAGAASTAIAVIGGVAQIASSLDLFGERARERARQLREQAVAFNRALEDFAITDRTSLDSQIRDQRTQGAALAKEAQGLIAGGKINEELFASLFEALGGIGDTVTSGQLKKYATSILEISKGQSSVAKDARALAGRFLELAETLEANEKLLQARNAAEIARLAEDLEVRRLVAAGLDEQADAERLRLQQLREVKEAEEKFGPESPYLASLKEVQAQEAAAAAAIKQRQAEEKRAQVETDVSARRAVLGGNDREAFVIRQTALSREQLAEAERLFEAGTITKEAFEELTAVIGEELVDAIGDFDRAAAAAAQRLQDDVAVRLLVAQGRDAEAEALRRQLANAEELRDVTDEAIRAQIIQAQTLEAAAQAASEALDEALRLREAARATAGNRIALFDLDGQAAFSETLAGYGQAFSALFREFDLSTLDGIAGAKDVLRGIFTELESLSDADILARFGLTRDELLAALLDTDSGLEGLSDSLTDVADKAREAAQAALEFADGLTDDFLRSQGRGQDADVRAATAKRDARLKSAAQFGLGADALAQIEAIYQSDLAEIAAKYAVQAAPASAPASSSGTAARAATRRASSNSSITQDFGGLSEITAQTLAGLLREVAINTGRDGAIVAAVLGRGAVPSLGSLSFPSSAVGGGGAPSIVIGPITVQISGMGIGGMTPNEAGMQVAQVIAREVGRLAGTEQRFLGAGAR